MFSTLHLHEQFQISYPDISFLMARLQGWLGGRRSCRGACHSGRYLANKSLQIVYIVFFCILYILFIFYIVYIVYFFILYIVHIVSFVYCMLYILWGACHLEYKTQQSIWMNNTIENHTVVDMESIQQCHRKDHQDDDICLSRLTVQVVPGPILIIVHVRTVLHAWYSKVNTFSAVLSVLSVFNGIGWGVVINYYRRSWVPPPPSWDSQYHQWDSW